MDIGADLEAELVLAEDTVWRGLRMVLVEGNSDRSSVETLARRLRIDLDERGVVVVALAGATNIGRFLDLTEGRVHGLCDLAEAGYFARALAESGRISDPEVDQLADAGFFVCHRDLEDEMIRALGTGAVLDLIDSEGEAKVFRRFANQPAHRGRPLEALVHRFIGTRAGRKIRFGALMAESVPIDSIPSPLRSLINTFA